MNPWILLIYLFLAGCSISERLDDPFEANNRNLFELHSTLQDNILLPCYGIYQSVLPADLRIGINNMSNNLNEVQNVVHDMLQGEWLFAISDAWRFALNSTIGIFGFFDFATLAGLPKHKQSLAHTMAVWGLEPGPYLVIPGLGGGYLAQHLSTATDYWVTPHVYLSHHRLMGGLILKQADISHHLLFISQIGRQGDDWLMVMGADDRYDRMRNMRLQQYQNGKIHMSYLDRKAELEDELRARYEDCDDEGDE